MQGGKEYEVSKAENEQDCMRIVQKERPDAKGATYYAKNKRCWAELGTKLVKTDKYRACVFIG